MLDRLTPIGNEVNQYCKMKNSAKILLVLLSVLVINLTHGQDELNSTDLMKNKQGEPFKEKPRSTEGNVTDFKSLPKTTSAAPTRRKSELLCDQLKRFKAKINRRTKRSTFVVGGRPSKESEFPHMGAVGWRAIKGTWIFICGSSLINSKYMLTAGHCSIVSRRYPNVAYRTPEIVRLGDRNIVLDYSKGQNAYNVKIEKIIKHPQYAPPKKYFDIAIIELEYDVDFDATVLPACLWSNHDTSSLGSKATLTGWGVIDTATLKTSTELQAAEVDIISSDACDVLLKPLCNHLWCGTSESQICAGKLSGGIDSCQGDSGGPLQVYKNSPSKNLGSIHYLIGITSFGAGCGQANTPAVYTRISSFIDWIESVAW